ncbi:glycosyltransferase family 39 protein [Marine Group I thaumarchaeote]|nr:glycosyltransferase family 39 protein [Marine Group I thaumarchaeote]
MSTKLNIVNTFENSAKKPIVFLVLIALAGLFLRLVYFPYDVPLFNDSQGYFWYAIDMSILNQLPPGNSLVNNGWPSFLSLIFQLMDSSNFLDYHNMQRFVGVVFSVATIFPVYFLCSMYFKKSYSLLGAALFIFEPKLIGNSFLGTPESVYVFLMASLLFLFLSNNFKKIYLAFGIVALLALVRYEGLIMIIPISIIFFIRFRKQKKDLIKYIICISIFILILVPAAYFKTETMGPRMDAFSHISAGPEYYQASIQDNSSALTDFLYLGSINLIKFLGWALIPSFIIFVPLGIIFIFKKIDYKKSTIIFTIVVMLLPAFYAYSRDIPEIKYIFVLYPIFCVLACFAFKIFLEKFQRKNLIFCMIIGGIILSSMIFVEWKAVENEHYQESYEILTEIGQKEMKINKELETYGGEFTYFSWVSLQNVDEFPILKKEIPPSKITTTSRPASSLMVSDWDKYDAIIKEAEEYHNPEIDNLRDYFQVLEKQKITHLLLDEINNSSLINDELRLHLRDIFNHENKYPFLVKEYDSRENGFNYHVKLFKIDYDLYNEWINEN